MCGYFAAISVRARLDPHVLRCNIPLSQCRVAYAVFFCHLKWLKSINKVLLGTIECYAMLSYSQIKERAWVWQRKCWICVRFQQNNSKESWKFTLHLNTELFSPVKAGWVQTSLCAWKIFLCLCLSPENFLQTITHASGSELNLHNPAAEYPKLV